jgi:hypothetical protein
MRAVTVICFLNACLLSDLYAAIRLVLRSRAEK